MKYQYDDSIIKIICGSKDDYIIQKTEFQVVREKSEYNIEYRKHQQEIRETEVDEMLNDIISKKSMRYLAKKYGKDFIKNHRAYREFASLVVLQETNNKALADAIYFCNYYNSYSEDDLDFCIDELNEIYDTKSRN